MTLESILKKSFGHTYPFFNTVKKERDEKVAYYARCQLSHGTHQA